MDVQVVCVAGDQNKLSLQEHIGFDIHVAVPHIQGMGAWADIDKC